MSDELYSVPPALASAAYLNQQTYRDLYSKAHEQRERFWATQATQYLTWISPWQTVLSGSFANANVRWFTGGYLNAAYNCLDRHLAKRKEQIALIWESDDPNVSSSFTYQALYERVCQMANVLKKYHVKKGDRVGIYLPMLPEAVITMLACARLGAIHCIVFAGFSAQSLQMRLLDADCQVLVTANESVRGNKNIPLKAQVDEALLACPQVQTVIVVQRTKSPVAWFAPRDVWYHEAMAAASLFCEPQAMEANDPLFILYTSGSTGKPKGIVHSTAGYLLYVAMTQQLVFDYQEQEIFWCTADIGWITGHSYAIYGPLLNGGTTLIFEGVPTFPTPARYWQIIDKHAVNIFYTAPTAIRALRREGDAWLQTTSRKSLRILGSVGEPINPEAWKWYYHIVGQSKCPIVDTWWQTETGGILITPLPGATPLKPGAAAWPFLGIEAAVINEQGITEKPNVMGKLIITTPWPGLMLGIYKDQARFVENYFKAYPGAYLTGDQAWQDAAGYYYIAGRSDDVIKVSGHRIGSQEVESALLLHHAVAEAAVVAVPDPIKGQAIYAFVNLKSGIPFNANLNLDLQQTVRKALGAIATPDYIQITEGLPKTRSGKIMRRILRQIALGQSENLGDLSTLADATVITKIIKECLPLKT